MRITYITLDFAQLLALIISIVFAVQGLVSWYVVILLVLYSFNFSVKLPI